MFLEVRANTIIVEARLLDQENQGRYRFTLAHELAHWLLHKEYIISAQNEAAYIDGTHSNKMEKQADYFASAILMPVAIIKKYYYSIHGKGYSKFEVIADMAERFSVSKQASIDNMLRITHEARLLGLDSRCIFHNTEPTPDSKVMKLLDNLEQNYHETAEQKGVQIVFCDIAINEDAEHFSVYEAIKADLVNRGIFNKCLKFTVQLVIQCRAVTLQYKIIIHTFKLIARILIDICALQCILEFFPIRSFHKVIYCKCK